MAIIMKALLANPGSWRGLNDSEWGSGAEKLQYIQSSAKRFFLGCMKSHPARAAVHAT